MDYLAHINENATRLRGAATDLEAQVPACPDWSLADLVYHVGEVHWFWSEIARRGQVEPPTEAEYPDPVRPEDGSELIEWAGEQTAALLAVLNDLDPAQPLWNWAETAQVGAFVPRRMAQETAVHRWDAEQAVGAPGPIELDLAVDGIAEYVEVFLASAGPYIELSEGTIGLVPTDHDRRWTIHLASPSVTVDDQDPTGADLIVAGAASDLLLALWLRDTPVQRTGDTALWDAWIGHVTEVNT